MKRWLPSILTPRRGDFMPTMIGGAMLVLGLPAFLMVLLDPDRGSGNLATGMMLLMGVLCVAGAALLVAGIGACSHPGSLIYRLSHGRILPRRRRRAGSRA